MAMTVGLAEPGIRTELEISLPETDRNRTGNGGPAPPIEPPLDPPRHTSELDPDRSATPPSAARLFTYFAMFWVVALFGTIAVVLETRWAQAANRFSIPLPGALYVSTLLLLASSVTIEFARRSLGAANVERSARAIFVSAMLGTAFLSSQIFAWQEFSLEGPRVAYNPGSFFFYLITGAHGALLLVGLAFLAFLGATATRAGTSPRRRSALGTIALYWQFLGVLWLCLFALLFTAIR